MQPVPVNRSLCVDGVLWIFFKLRHFVRILLGNGPRPFLGWLDFFFFFRSSKNNKQYLYTLCSRDISGVCDFRPTETWQYESVIFFFFYFSYHYWQPIRNEKSSASCIHVYKDAFLCFVRYNWRRNENPGNKRVCRFRPTVAVCVYTLRTDRHTHIRCGVRCIRPKTKYF